jgi:hypothetical protein
MPLCDRCQRFDLQSFKHGARGFRLSELRTSSEQGCDFCSLLIEALDETLKSKPTSLSISSGINLTDDDGWLHIVLNQNYVQKQQSTANAGFEANRFLVGVGHRHVSTFELIGEICLAADLREYLKLTTPMLNGLS